MTPVLLLNELKAFLENVTGDMQLEVKVKPGAEPDYRPPKVYKGKLPSKEGITQQVPYIIARVLNGNDEEIPGEPTQSIVRTRIIIATYSRDGEEGYTEALNVMTRIRTALLESRIISNQFILVLDKDTRKLDYEIYEDDTGSYTIGDMIAYWSIPSIERKWRDYNV